MPARKFHLRNFIAALCLLAGLNTHAQITDAFSDGDFTANPAWSGDAAEYTVNAGFQLQLNGTIADTSYLSMPSPFISNAEWQFWVRLNFSPSDNNNARIYLVSDVPNLKGAVNGYYVRLGENGSFDSVDLWEQSGNTHTKIIDGVNAHCAAANNVLRIKVTRDAAGNWSLLSDTLGGTNFQPEGTVFDNTHTTCNYFGVFSKYTVSNINRFYYDDFYLGPIIVDVTAPAIVSANAISATQLDVLFNESVDLATSQTTGNYSVNNSIGNPVSAVRDGSNTALVHLTFGNSFVNSVNYTLTVTSVEDVNANAITTATASFTYLPLSTPVYHDVVINEIMADPSPVVGLPNAEFVELYNRSANNFDLNGWTLSDGSTTGTLAAHVLPAGGYVIVCAAADTASFSPFGPAVGISAFPSLNNAGDHLEISDASSTIIDSVNYDISWYQDALKDDGGWTLELINPDAGTGCAAGGNWIASNNAAGGTPGVQNSVFNNSPDVTGPALVSAWAADSLHVELCFNEAIDPALLTNLNNYDVQPFIGQPVSVSYDTATMRCVTLTLSLPLANDQTYNVLFPSLADCAGNAANPGSAMFTFHRVQAFDVVINEIMPDPDPPVLLPNEEYIELHNTTAFPIKLDSWTIAAGTTVRVLPEIFLPADSFVVLTGTTAAPLFTGVFVAGVTSFPSLTNTGADLTLRAANGMVVHSVSYSDSWYRNSAKAGGGWSLEQVDPLNPCGGAENWTAANSNSGGTPGYRNSVEASNPDNTAPRLLRVSVLAADSIRLWFSEPLDSLSMSDVMRYTINSSIGNPLSVHPNGPGFTSVDLELATPISAGLLYMVTVSSQVTDCVGNAGPGSSALFALPEPALPNDIVINEVLFDPNDGGVDFVEIYNRSQKVLDLKNILLCSQDTLTNTLTELNVIAPEGYLFFPGQYLVLSESGATVQQHYPAATNINLCLDMDNIPAMNVDGDIVVLADTGFHIIDRLVFSGDWHFPLLQTTKGVSLERIDFDRATQDYTNWHSAAETAGFATPTQKNSQYIPGGSADDRAVSVTQQVFSPDGDGYQDVVNIDYNFSTPGFVANVTIYDARGRLVRTLIRSELLGTETGTFSWDGTMDDRTKARVGIYVIYFEVFNSAGEVKKYKRTCVLAGRM